MTVATHAGAVGTGGTICEITATSIGPVKIGMTVKDARKALPQATFKVTEGLDDLVILEAHVGKEQVWLSPLGDGPPPGRSLLDSTMLKSLETFSEQCRDDNGVGPGTPLRDAASKLGGVKEIVMSEIESREYVTFGRQPKGRWYRIDYTGIFAPESPSRTTDYQPEAKIMAVGVDGVSHD